MKLLTTFIFATIVLFSLPSTSYSQENTQTSSEYLLEEFKNSPEIMEKLDHNGIERSRIKLKQELDTPSQESKIEQPEKKSKENFTLKDALGGVDLNDDPVVKRAKKAEALRESQNTVTSTSVIPSTVEIVDTEIPKYESSSNYSWLGIIPILIGIAIWYFWSQDYNKGQQNPMDARRVHDGPAGCVPNIIAVVLIGIGIFIIFSS